MRVWMQTTKLELRDYNVHFQAGIGYAPAFHAKPEQQSEREEHCHATLVSHRTTKFLHIQFLSLLSLSFPR